METTKIASYLTIDELALLVTGLWTAIEQYDEYVGDLSDAVSGTDLSLLRNQFAKQAADLRTLREKIETAEWAALGPVAAGYKEPTEDEQNCPF